MGFPSKTSLAAEVWRGLFGFFLSTRAQRDRVLAQLGLTPNDVRALGSLDQREGRTMRHLADEWACDASNATWIVDRLEKLGLAERRTVPEDRRVKLVVMTATGAKKKAELLKGVYEPPPELLALSEADLATLRDAVAKLPQPRDPVRNW
jgi:DNA-binding MarR family transcriptional regulator